MIKQFSIFLVALLFSLITLAANPLLHTDYGTYEGKVNYKGTKIFLGMAFAAPPVGALRWRAPQPPEKFSGVRRAFTSGPEALQENPLTGKVIGSEDCLYLNMWIPENPTGKKLPIVFWIHGGAFVLGSSNQKVGLLNIYDGIAMAEKGEIIFASANHRLGPMGTMAHPDLIAEDVDKNGQPRGSTGNYDLLDIIAALEFLQAHGERVGGDIHNVKVIGESAGGGHAFAVLASPLAKGLVHGVLPQSGVATDYSLESAIDQTYRMMGKYFKNPKAVSIDDFREVDGASIVKDFPLLTKWNEVRNNYGHVVDRVALVKPIVQTIVDDEHNKVPVLIGTNSNEMNVLGPAMLRHLPKNFTDEDYKTIATELIGREQAELAMEYYTKERFGSNKEALMALLNDGKFHATAAQIAKALTESASPKGVFQYLYTRKYLTSFLNKIGAGHAMELPFVFGNKALLAFISYDPFRPISSLWRYYSNLQFSDTMMKRWTNFFWYGTPNNPNDKGQGLRWPNARSGKMMIFSNDGEEVKGNMHFDSENVYSKSARSVWKKISYPKKSSGLLCTKAQNI